MKNLKPFDLQTALAGKAVMLRGGGKAYVRHHETELDVCYSYRLLGYTDKGGCFQWCADGKYYADTEASDHDIIGMYPETRIINGFEVPAPETEALEEGRTYFLAMPHGENLHIRTMWEHRNIERLWIARGLIFLNREDAIANAKAMLGIDPYEGDK